MPGYGSYLAALIDYWGGIGQSAAARIQAAQREIFERRYTPGKFVSDLLGFWNDNLEGWWTALVASGTAPVQTVLFVVERGAVTDEAKARLVPIIATVDDTAVVSTGRRQGG